jgi:DNA helicase-2/ATP-dependent DNA helicase PcrA
MAIKNPSKYQLDIFKTYNTTKKNIFIQATAGSGKSTVIVELINQTPIHKKVCVVAFNKSIAEEMKSKVRQNVDVSTLHAKGMKLLRENLKCRLKVNAIKNWVFGKQIFHEYLDRRYKKNEKDKSIHLFTLSKLVDLYRMNVVEPTVENLMKLSDMYSVDADPVEIEQSLKLIDFLNQYNESNPEELVIDFTDMLWLPYKFVKNSEYPKYDVLFCDELQDISPLQKKLIDNLLGNRSRFVGVGDENQSIYQFLGANSLSLNSFRDAPNTAVLPLSVSYRCSKSIVREASKIFPGIEAYEGNPEGSVRYGTLDEVRPGDFILCRNNLPLAEQYINMLGSNKKSYILGKDFGKSLSSLVAKIDNIKDLDIILNKKKENLKARGVQNVDSNLGFQSLMEKCQIVRMLFNRHQSLDKVKSILETMFTEDDQIDKSTSIIFSTIHKAKGLESKRVFVINLDLIPSKYATTASELLQEKCLKFVLFTRGKEDLIIVNGKEDNIETINEKEIVAILDSIDPRN